MTNEQKLSVLFGMKVEIKDIGYIRPMLIKEIHSFGIDKYNKAISILCLDQLDILEMLDYETEEFIRPYEFLIQNALFGDDDIKEDILMAFEMVLRQPVEVDKNGVFYVNCLDGRKIINEDKFYEIVELVKYQACVVKSKDRVRPKNEAQKKYLKQLRKIRALRQEREGSESELIHIISSVCSVHPNYNFSNIQDLTIFQLIDQYKRLCSVEEYSHNIQALIHGASNKEMKIKHWSEPMLK